MNAVIEKLIPKADTWVKQVLEKNTAGMASLNAYMTINSDTLFSKSTTGAACYGSIGGYFGDNQNIIVNWIAVGNAMENWRCSHGDRKHKFTREELVKYFSYLSHKSPFRRAFITKSGNFMVDKGYAFMRADMPGNYLVAAMTATRQAWEGTTTVRAWLSLRKMNPSGDPNWHFMLANQMDVQKIENNDVFFTLRPYSSGHSPFESRGMTTETVRNYITYNPLNKHRHTIQQTRNYRGVHELFRDDTQGSVMTTLLDKSLKQRLEGLDVRQSAFAWNMSFTGLTDQDLKMYSLKKNIPILEDLYDKHFGGI